jgi:hypothetical protein
LAVNKGDRTFDGRFSRHDSEKITPSGPFGVSNGE